MSKIGNWRFIEIDECVFPLEVVMKATYWLSGRYLVDVIRVPTRGVIRVGVAHETRDLTDEEHDQTEIRFRRDLIDFRTRALIDGETRTLRELLVAKAFEHGDDV